MSYKAVQFADLESIGSHLDLHQSIAHKRILFQCPEASIMLTYQCIDGGRRAKAPIAAASKVRSGRPTTLEIMVFTIIHHSVYANLQAIAVCYYLTHSVS